MDISERLRTAIETSVLCWLATVDADGQPNVSPKEIFCMGAGPNEVLVAEIASPVSKRNLSKNPKVCISAVDIFAQRVSRPTEPPHSLLPRNRILLRLCSLLHEWRDPSSTYAP